MATGVIAAPLPSFAQSQKLPRVLVVYTEGIPARDAFRQGLRDRGWSEGKNVAVEIAHLMAAWTVSRRLQLKS
jgi:hypothetical protein